MSLSLKDDILNAVKSGDPICSATILNSTEGIKPIGDPASKTVDWFTRRAHKPVSDIYPKKDSYTLYLEKELNRHISMLRSARAHIHKLNKIIRTQLLGR